MLYNYVDLTPFLRIKTIKGRGMAGHKLTTLTVPAMDGSHYQRKKKPPRILEVEANIIAKDRPELRTKIDDLNGILSVDEPVPVVFPDEPDITYYGIPEATSENEEFHFMHQGTLTIICPDPYKYGKTHKTIALKQLTWEEYSGETWEGLIDG